MIVPPEVWLALLALATLFGIFGFFMLAPIAIPIAGDRDDRPPGRARDAPAAAAAGRLARASLTRGVWLPAPRLTGCPV